MKELIAKLTLIEKAKLLSGRDTWSTFPVDRLGIPSIYMSDGPHGLRKAAPDVAIGESLPATCFPTASALASTWNVELLEKVGETIAKECLAQDVQVLLGPGINIKRSPLGGRNFEYFSEDPLLSGKLGGAFVRGVEKEGVGTCVKHYTANNQESERMYNSSNLDERTLREIYLRAFEIVVKEAAPSSLMCAYNQVNRKWASENAYLLTKILKKEWTYKGIVVSDWGAVYHPEKAAAAGLHLEMPSNPLSWEKIVKAVDDGRLTENQIDVLLEPLLDRILTLFGNRKSDVEMDVEKHHKMALSAARESIVLLKNDTILPLNPAASDKVCIVGQFAVHPRYQGGGSSEVNATRVENCLTVMQEFWEDKGKISYAPGYQLEGEEIDHALLNQAIAQAREALTVVVFVGLPDAFELEGIDRPHMKLPTSHTALVNALIEVNDNVVVVLTNGSAVEMDWAPKVSAIVEGWLCGQAGGRAMAEVLTGAVNPSGKLSESFGLKLEHNPSFLNFPGYQREVEYKEGVFVGYRYYDIKKMDVRFPFGHGLSYTDFYYSNLKVEKFNEALGQVCIIFDLKNTGEYEGQEVVQLYVKPIDSSILRPEKELKAFQKVHLSPSSVATVKFDLSRRDFSFYDVETASWKMENGKYEICIGSSSRDIRVSKEVIFTKVDEQVGKRLYDKYTSIKELLEHPKGRPYVKEMMALLKVDLDNETADFSMRTILMSMPIAKRVNFSEGTYTEEMLTEFVNDLNQ